MPGKAGRMRAILQYLKMHEGVASLGELMANGHDMSTIWLLADSKRHVFRVCKGIYALNGTSELVLDASRAGGQLDCISALVHHGEREPVPGDKLHIRVTKTARPRRAQARDDVVIHWSRRPFSGTRASVTIEEARRQAEGCRALAGRAGADTL